MFSLFTLFLFVRVKIRRSPCMYRIKKEEEEEENDVFRTSIVPSDDVC